MEHMKSLKKTLTKLGQTPIPKHLNREATSMDKKVSNNICKT